MPGFIFIKTIDWLNKQKSHNTTVLILLSCAWGYILNSLIFPVLTHYCSKQISIILCFVICLILGLLVGKCRTSKFINNVFGFLFSKTLNNFYEDVLDFKKGSNIIAHMNNGKQIYGQVQFLDDTENPKWIYLKSGIVYIGEEPIDNVCTDDAVIGIIVPTQDIEYIEVT